MVTWDGGRIIRPLRGMCTIREFYLVLQRFYVSVGAIANGWLLFRFMVKKKLRTQGHVHLAAHQTAVELCLLHALKKPLTGICDVVEHDEEVFKMIWETKIQPGANGQWDGVLEYPSKEAESALVYIFEQIGGQSEPVAAEATGEASSEAENTAEDASEASPEFEEPVQETVSQPQGPFFGYADVSDTGFLSLSLNDPATKFAVCFHPFITVIMLLTFA